MGGFVPNPLALGAIKAAAYAGFGWTVRPHASRPRNPVLFGLARVGAGFLVGITFAMLMSRANWSESGIYMLFLVPRLVLWAALLHVWFRPKGGARALLLWSLAGTAVSSAIDLLVFQLFEQVPWLRMSFC